MQYVIIIDDKLMSEHETHTDCWNAFWVNYWPPSFEAKSFKFGNRRLM